MKVRRTNKATIATETANRRSVTPSHEDIREAYSEAVEHLEACALNCSIWDNPDEMRAAYRVVAKRIRNAAKRHNDSGERQPPPNNQK